MYNPLLLTSLEIGSNPRRATGRVIWVYCCCLLHRTAGRSHLVHLTQLSILFFMEKHRLENNCCTCNTCELLRLIYYLLFFTRNTILNALHLLIEVNYMHWFLVIWSPLGFFWQFSVYIYIYLYTYLIFFYWFIEVFYGFLWLLLVIVWSPYIWHWILSV